MKSILAIGFVSFVASIAMAADPAPSIVGTWVLQKQECSSGVAEKGGLRTGQDTSKVTFAEDTTLEIHSVQAGCEFVSKGSYLINGSLLTTTITSGRSCRMADPVPSNETKTVFMIVINENDFVTVATGAEAAKICPEGDALIVHHQRAANSPF
ncbi:MAG: hypothetical protein EOP06_19840 [Proteobacteria bacterium]|nr:MAG: hypothetical protein EOP06_19840 [Pseudomonadota bacterium]